MVALRWISGLIEARQLLEQLPDDATWGHALYEFAIRHSIERGLADVAEGRILSSARLRAALALD